MTTGRLVSTVGVGGGGRSGTRRQSLGGRWEV